MQHFHHDGFDIAYIDEGDRDGEPILLIHGFASTYRINWVQPGWIQTLSRAGYRVIAFDHRGHGETTKSYDTSVYTPAAMASDAVALLDHLGIARAHVFGYSMGARVSAFMALEYPDRIASLIFGGLGMGMVDGVGDWDPIAEALRASSLDDVSHPRGRMFRAFADQTKSDREALAACIATSRQELSEADMGKIEQPTLVAVGTTDDIAGDAHKLAHLMPHATAFDIIGRDHMLSVGDRTFKARALEFLKEHPL
ncbi:alpha/beta fold hydrolase [Aliihoeflea sp. PC F10.4]